MDSTDEHNDESEVRRKTRDRGDRMKGASQTSFWTFARPRPTNGSKAPGRASFVHHRRHSLEENLVVLISEESIFASVPTFDGKPVT